MAKPFKELEFKDNFMFSATMLDPENCRLVLERILEFTIEHVEVVKEKCIVYHPDFKGNTLPCQNVLYYLFVIMIHLD